MPFNFLIQLAIAAVFFVVGELLRPKPDFEDAEAIPYEDANFPSIDPNKKQPVVWGRVDLRAVHVMDMVEYTQLAITKKVKTSLFASERVTIGFRYFLGMQLGLCKGIDSFHNLFVDDRSVPLGAADDQGDNGIVYNIDEPDFLGGKENGGGLAGLLRVYKGGSTQNPSTYLGGFRADNPAYRWASHMVVENFEVGESPNIDKWAVQVSRYPDPLGLGGDNQIGQDLNPMSIVIECLYDDDFGFGLDASEVNESTFSAVAAVLKAEGLGMSLKWVNNQSIDRIIDTVNKTIDGVMRYNPSSGKWEYKLIREDFTLMNLPVLDETNIKNMTAYARASWDETINQIELKYTERGTTQKPSPAMAEDRSNFIRQGRQKTVSLNFPGIYDSTIAATVAARELKTYGFPLSTCELLVDREGFNLLPGDPFVFTWPQLGIVQLVMRVGDIGFGTDDQLELNISAIEDIFSVPTATFASPPPSGWTEIIETPQAIALRRAQDTPYVFAIGDPTQTIGSLLDTVLGFAARPQGNALGYTLLVRDGTDPFVVEDDGTYLPTGLLQSAIAEAGADPEGSVVITTMLDAPLISEDVLVDASIQKNFLNLALIISTVLDPFDQLGGGSTYLAEFIAYEDATVVGSTVTLTNVHRGMMDTLPAGHNVGDRIWFLTGVLIDGPTVSVSKMALAEDLDARFQGEASTGTGAQSSTTAVTSVDRPNLPYNAGNFKVNSSRYPAGLVTAGGTIDITWNHRNRLADEILYQSEAIDQEASAGVPETGFEYVLEIFRDDGTSTHLRRVVATGSSIPIGSAGALDNFETTANISFFYTNALQITDGGPFAKYRLELIVTNSGQTVDGLIDVMRTVNVDLPLDFLERGQLHDLISAENPGVYFPMAELSGAFVDVSGGGGPNMTAVGNIGYANPGPGPGDKSVFVPATLNTYLTIVDDATNDLSGRVFIQFWFRMGPVDGVNITPLIYKGDPTDIGSYSWRFYVDTTGKIDGDHNGQSANKTFTYDAAPRVDDGEWHHFAMYGTNGSKAWVDGQALLHCATGASFSGNIAQPIVFAGHNDATSAGLADIEVAHLAFWDDEGFVGGTTTANFDSLYKFLSRSWKVGLVHKHPYLEALFALGPDLHYEMNYSMTDDTAPTNMSMLELANGQRNAQQTNAIPVMNGGVNDVANHHQVGPLVGQRSVAMENKLGTAGLSTYMQLGSFNATDTVSSPPLGANDLPAGDWDENSFNCWIKLPIGHSTRGMLYAVYVGSSLQNSISFHVNASNQLSTLCTHNHLTSFYRLVESDFALPEDEWIMVSYTKALTGDPVFYMNGKDLGAVTVTFNNAEWDVVGRWGPGVFEGASDAPILGLFGAAGGDIGDSSPLENCDWPVAHVSFWLSTELNEGQLRALYLAGVMPNLSVTEMLSRDNPENVYALDDVIGAADQFTNSADGDPTETGTTVDDTLAIEVDIAAGRVQGVVTPLGFRGAEHLLYSSPMLELSFDGDDDMDDYTIIEIFRLRQQGTVLGIITINKEADTTSGGADIGYITAYDDDGGSGGTIGDLRVFQNSPAGGGDGGVIGEDYDGQERSSFLVKQELEATPVRRSYLNGVLLQTAADFGEYGSAGADITKFLIGGRDTATSELFVEADIAYVAAWGRIVSTPVWLRVFLRFIGLGPYPIAVLQHGIEALYPLDEVDDSTIMLTAKNVSPVPLRDLTLANTPAKALFLTGPTGIRLNGGLLFDKAASEDAQGVSEITAAAPYIIGGWFRADNGSDDAFVSASAVGSTNQFISVGIFGDLAGFKIGAASAITSGAVTFGDWAHIMVIVRSITDKDIYLNGELQLNYTTSLALPTPLDTFAINSRVESSGVTFADGSYSGIFTGTVTLDAKQCMEIYVESLVDMFAGLVLTHADLVMYFPLDEYIDAQLTFHDNFDRTLVGTGTGMTQGAIGIIPQRKSLCVDFDGSGDVDLARTDYPAGTVNRVIEFWVEGGYEGIVCSMGANTDAQSLTVAVDNAGDVRVHIRGSGNERIFTAAIDAGTEHHVAIELNGTLLTDIECYVNGVLASIGTAGSGTTLATTATENLILGQQHANLTTLPGGVDDPYNDAIGKLQGFAIYDAAWGADTTASAIIAADHNDAGRA